MPASVSQEQAQACSRPIAATAFTEGASGCLGPAAPRQDSVRCAASSPADVPAGTPVLPALWDGAAAAPCAWPAPRRLASTGNWTPDSVCWVCASRCSGPAAPWQDPVRSEPYSRWCSSGTAAASPLRCGAAVPPCAPGLCFQELAQACSPAIAATAFAEGTARCLGRGAWDLPRRGSVEHCTAAGVSAGTPALCALRSGEVVALRASDLRLAGSRARATRRRTRFSGSGSDVHVC